MLNLIVLASFAQNGSIKGTVKTSDGQAAPYVNVFIKENNKGTSTDETGSFVIKNAKAGSYPRQTSFVGFTPLGKKLRSHD